MRSALLRQVAPRWRWPVLALVTSFALVSCGHSAHGPQAGETDPGQPSKIGLLPSAVPSSATTIDADTAAMLDSAPWRLVAVHGRTLSIVYATGSPDCQRPKGAYVKETTTQVLIGTYVDDLSGPSACGDVASHAFVSVRLQEPLGSRTLLHVVVGPSWVNQSP